MEDAFEKEEEEEEGGSKIEQDKGEENGKPKEVLELKQEGGEDIKIEEPEQPKAAQQAEVGETRGARMPHPASKEEAREQCDTMKALAEACDRHR